MFYTSKFVLTIGFMFLIIHDAFIASIYKSCKRLQPRPGLCCRAMAVIAWVSGCWSRIYFIFMPMLCMMKAKMSAVSSKRFESGLPPPWPALVSMRMSTGALPA